MQVRQTSLLFVAVLGMLMPGVRTRAVTIPPPPLSLAKCSIPAAAPQAGDSQAAPGQAGASSGRATVLPVGQVQHFAKANLTVSAGTTTDGAIQIEARGTNLTFRKKVSANGRYTVEIEGPRDKVALSVTESSIAVTRGKKTLTVSPDSSQSQLDDVRKLLVDSRAVDMLRSAGAEFEVSEEDSSAATPVLLVDALVGSLTGDVGAARRAARHLSRRARSALRPAGRPNTCYYQWEQSIIWAYVEMEDCFFSGYFFPTWCTLRWAMQAESAWFGLLACSGLGWR